MGEKPWLAQLLAWIAWRISMREDGELRALAAVEDLQIFFANEFLKIVVGSA